MLSLLHRRWTEGDFLDAEESPFTSAYQIAAPATVTSAPLTPWASARQRKAATSPISDASISRPCGRETRHAALYASCVSSVPPSARHTSNESCVDPVSTWPGLIALQATPLRRAFQRDAARQTEQSGLRRTVRGKARRSHTGGRRRDVDDPAEPSLDHRGKAGADRSECSGEIRPASPSTSPRDELQRLPIHLSQPR
jgi:hypothetical protein